MAVISIGASGFDGIIMTKDRKIVLLLIRRARRAKRRLDDAHRLEKINPDLLFQRSIEWAEAINAAELARRILYDNDKRRLSRGSE